MRTTIAVVGLFAALGTTVGVGATTWYGSDTLTSVAIACGGDTYLGGGSTIGQAALGDGTQLTAPMTRMLNSGAGFCTQAASTLQRAEGIVFGLDGISVVANSSWATCNGTNTADCTPDTSAGLMNNKLITPNPSRTCTVDANCNTAGIYGEVCSGGVCKYNIASWKEALRILFAGQSAPGNNLSQRNCNSPERQYLAANWNNIFQSCSSADCPSGIRHAFRMGDESATSEVFVQLLNLPAIDVTNNVSPFCNVATRGPSFFVNPNAPTNCVNDSDCAPPGGTAPASTCSGGHCQKCWMPVSEFETGEQTDAETNSGPLPPPTAGYASVPVPTKILATVGDTTNANRNRFIGPNWTDAQDADVIRRPCSYPQEDVCAARGDLGLVLPISVPTGALSDSAVPDPLFPTEVCTTGKFGCFLAFRTNSPMVTSQSTYALCPDGADPNLLSGNQCPKGQCAYPVNIRGGQLDPRCWNTLRTNNPSGDLNISSGAKVDARVYNLTAWTIDLVTPGLFVRVQESRATALGDPACGIPAIQGNIISRGTTGAYYRIHANHSFKTIGSSPFLCAEHDATKQIGCLVQASPCSIGVAGRNAWQSASSGIALKVGGIDPAPQCLRNLLSGGNTYPLARKLYVNTAIGFDVSANALAECVSKRSIIDPILATNGFVSLSATPSTRPTFCEDFNEADACGASTNVDACKDSPANPSPVPMCEIGDPVSSCPGL